MVKEYKAQPDPIPISLEAFLCVESASRIICEAKEFDDAVIVRPVDPQLYPQIARLTPKEFAERFEAFTGDMKEVTKYVRR